MARKAIFYAQEEAQRLGTYTVDQNCLLLGLLRLDGECVVSSDILEKLGIDRSSLQRKLQKSPADEAPETGEQMTLSKSAKRVINLAYDCARNLNDNYIGTEHLLLGILQEGNSTAARLLDEAGAGFHEVLKVVMTLQEDGRSESKPDPVPENKTIAPEEERVPADYEKLLLVTRQKVFTPRLLLLLAITEEGSEGYQAFANAAGLKAKILHYLLEDRLLRNRETPNPIGIDQILAKAANIASERSEPLSSKHIFLAIYGLKADPYLQELIGDMSLENLMKLLDEE